SAASSASCTPQAPSLIPDRRPGSHADAQPISSARTGTPRSRACCGDSSTRYAPASPMVMPVRPRSYGRQTLAGSSPVPRTPVASSSARNWGRRGASAPPPSATSHAPLTICSAATPSADDDDAQVAETVSDGPLAPVSIASAPLSDAADPYTDAVGRTRRSFVEAPPVADAAEAEPLCPIGPRDVPVTIAIRRGSS